MSNSKNETPKYTALAEPPQQVIPVSEEEWEKSCAKSGLKYPDVYEAIDYLRIHRIGARFKLAGGRDINRKRKLLSQQATRYGIRVATHIYDGWIYMCSVQKYDTPRKKPISFQPSRQGAARA